MNKSCTRTNTGLHCKNIDETIKWLTLTLGFLLNTLASFKPANERTRKCSECIELVMVYPAVKILASTRGN